MLNRVIAIAGGFALDRVLGDPHNWPHPVRLIGKHIELEERVVREQILEATKDMGDAWPLDRAQTEVICGAAVVTDVALIAPLATAAALAVCRKVHPALGIVAETLLCYQLIAARSLQDESMAVHDALAVGDVEGARSALSMIVGRDTANLDEKEIARAAVETVAENTSDGVVAPLLFAGAGGIPAAMFYKAVNTLDSMMGYKNEEYEHLGWAAAKLDDAVNVIPARVSGALMCIAAKLVGMDGERAWKVFERDRYNHTSPNSAHTEAACAGALGVQLGGPSKYGGVEVGKPTIGDPIREIEAFDIVQANKLMYATAALGAGVACVLGLLSRRR